LFDAFFLNFSTLAQALGMVSQEVFAKREKNGAKKNTHLVCKGDIHILRKHL
jgi:hypothetical protein